MTEADATATTSLAKERRMAATPAGDVSGKRSPSRRGALLTASALALAPILGTAQSLTADADLIALGKRLEAAWAAETAAWDALPEHDEYSPSYDHACNLSEAAEAIAATIERAPATTLPGLLVKGRAWRWSRGTDAPPTAGMFDLGPVHLHLEASSDQRLALSLLTDLHRMTEAAA